MSQPSPGWYPDPKGRQRYWTGTEWGPAAAQAVKKPMSPAAIFGLFFIAGLLLMGGCLGVAKLGGTPSSSSSSVGDTKDKDFLSALAAKDVPVRGDADRRSLIDTGRGVCTVLKTPGNDLVDVMAYVAKEQRQLSSEQRAAIAPAALSVYCPGWHP